MPLPLTFLKTITRRITIPVDVPTIQILYTAQLHILPTTQNPGVGTALPAELTISHTRAWAHSSPAPPTPAAPMPFHYDLDAPADTWLIGGKRRGFFSSGENEFLSFPILLLPQRAGHLILPSLDIKIADGQQQTETSAAAPSPQPLRTGDLSVPSSAILSPRPGTVSGSIVACEVDYRSQGVAVLVVPALTRVTVGVEMETPDRAQNGGSTGTWLIKGEGTELVA